MYDDEPPADDPRATRLPRASALDNTSATRTPRLCDAHDLGHTGYFGRRDCHRCMDALRVRDWHRLRRHLEDRPIVHAIWTRKHTDDPLGNQINDALAHARAIAKLCKRDPAVVGGYWFYHHVHNDDSEELHPHVHFVIECDRTPDWIDATLWTRRMGATAEDASRLAWYLAKPAHHAIMNDRKRVERYIRATYRKRLRNPFGTWSKAGIFSRHRRKRPSRP